MSQTEAELIEEHWLFMAGQKGYICADDISRVYDFNKYEKRFAQLFMNIFSSSEIMNRNDFNEFRLFMKQTINIYSNYSSQNIMKLNQAIQACTDLNYNCNSSTVTHFVKKYGKKIDQDYCLTRNQFLIVSAILKTAQKLAEQQQQQSLPLTQENIALIGLYFALD